MGLMKEVAINDSEECAFIELNDDDSYYDYLYEKWLLERIEKQEKLVEEASALTSAKD